MEKWIYQCQLYIRDEYCIPTQTDNLACEMISNNLLSYHKRLYISEITHDEKKINELIEHLRDPNYPTIQKAFHFLVQQFTSEGYTHISQKLQQTLEEVAQLEQPPQERPHEAVQRLHDNIDNITRNQMKDSLKQLRAQIVPQGFEDVEGGQEDHHPAIHQDTVDTCDDSYTALMKATIDGDLALVTRIITTDPQCVNEVNKRRATALMLAVTYSSLQIIQTIFGCELTDVNLRDPEGRTAVFHAISRGNVNVMRVLDSNRVDTTIYDKQGFTCEYYAFGESMVKHIKRSYYTDSIKKDKDNLEWNKITNVIKYLLMRPNINQSNLMKICLIFRDEKIVQLVVQSGWKPTKIENGQSFILNIIKTTNPILVKLLTTFNINIDPTEVNKIMRSVMRHNCPDTCAALLEQVTNLNVDNVRKSMLFLQSIKPSALSYTLKHSTLDMNERDADRRTVFILACMDGRYELVDQLLQFLKPSGADLDTSDMFGWTPLHCASMGGHSSVVETLTQCPAININIPAISSRTALHLASTRGHSSVVETLIQCPGISINTRDVSGWTALHLASTRGHSSVVETLIQCPGISINTPDVSGWTPLHLASEGGHSSVVETLLRCPGININILDILGRTPLHFASMNSHSSVIETLIQYPGININTPDKSGKTPLHWASMWGHSSVVETLIQYPGININTPDDSGMTPLHWASMWGHSSVVETLIQCPGISINTPDVSGWTPLHLASERGHSSVVETLLRCPGININILDILGRTPLHFASMNSHSSVIETLIQYPGININTPDDSGMTPLHWASMWGHSSVVETLIQCPGININTPDKSSKTPFQLAQQRNDHKIVSLLQPFQHDS